MIVLGRCSWICLAKALNQEWELLSTAFNCPDLIFVTINPWSSISMTINQGLADSLGWWFLFWLLFLWSKSLTCRTSIDQTQRCVLKFLGKNGAYGSSPAYDPSGSLMIQMKLIPIPWWNEPSGVRWIWCGERFPSWCVARWRLWSSLGNRIAVHWLHQFDSHLVRQNTWIASVTYTWRGTIYMLSMFLFWLFSAVWTEAGLCNAKQVMKTRQISGPRVGTTYHPPTVAMSYLGTAYHQCKAYVREYPHKIWPYMVQYLHFRILEFPLIWLDFMG